MLYFVGGDRRQLDVCEHTIGHDSTECNSIIKIPVGINAIADESS